MKLHWKAFTTSKFGNRAEDNEDKYWPNDLKKVLEDCGGFYCAISDGATSSSFSKLWADLLVRQVTRTPVSSRSISKVVRNASEIWSNQVGRLNLPWHAELKAKQGAFATLLCLNLWQPTDHSLGSGTWRAIAIGDSCMFQFRDGQRISTYPIESSQDFTNSPVLLSSQLSRNMQVWGNLSEKSGDWQSGDEFLLMTDAISGWFLRMLEEGHSPLECIHNAFLHDSATSDAFDLWINDMRSRDLIHNDDTTIVWLKPCY